MKTAFTYLFLFFFIATKAQTLYFPSAGNTDWDTTAPASLNFCQPKVDSLYSFLDQQLSKSFILLKDGKIVLEKYFNTFTQDSLWAWFSAGKSLRSTLIGIAQQEGHLNIYDKSSDYLDTGWTSMPRAKEDSIKIWHQLTMTSGLDESEFFCTDPQCLTYKADAGTRWVYHNGPYSLLKDVLENATGQGINLYTQQRIKNPTGMSSGLWVPVGYNTFYFSNTRDAARFGLLIQNKGVWNTTTLLTDTAYFNQMTNSSQALNPSYGYLWWLNGKSSFIPSGSPNSYPGSIAPNAPADMITAAGAQGQFISTAPSTGYTLVRFGSANDTNLAPLNLIDEIWKRVIDLPCTGTTLQEDIFKDIILHPNPTTAYFSISGVPENTHLEIYSINGKALIQKEISKQAKLHFSFKKGIYIVKLSKGSQVHTEKLVIQ